ncbi:ATP-dependent DNA ligase [Actinoplanes sp. NPDC024001]|uniref:ATP-dependent DNA ligase n=1 Tax=Actinoplanes sp. NPDC024001 TaxID=3154598 RepID=UPI0033CBD6F1
MSLENDGWRCVAFAGRRDVFLQSRHGRDLTAYFPDIVAQLDAALLPDVVLDGEIVSWDPETGRTSFAALAARVSAGRRIRAEARVRPAGLVVFDLLEVDGIALLDRPLLERRMLLEELLSGLTQPALCPATRDPAEARRWFDDYAATGAEGLVIKDLTSTYSAKGRGWWKWRRRTTTEAIIGGVVGTRHTPQALLLGIRPPDGSRLRYAGRTAPLSALHRAELVPHLRAPVTGHPWPRPLPAGWAGPFDQREPLDFVPVEPELIAEIEADEAFEHGRWRHAVRYVRLRTDRLLPIL